jgi:1-phosphatidylinositol-3-phosphate 5-kinase
MNHILGLIYCSRCASNIIKGSRFGQDGMIRVCNLCLDQIAKVDEDDDQDDRRSIASAATSSFPDIMTLGYGGRKRHPLMSSHGPQSPFNLFGKADEPFNLFSIAETRRTLSFGSDDSALNSRPGTPDAEIGIEALGVPVRAAPFRRSTFPDDDKDTGVTVIEPDQPAHIGSPLQTQTRSPIDFPRTMAVPQVGPSSITFPGSSSDQGGDYEGPFSGGLVRSRFNSLADVDALPTPFIRSRVQSRLMDSLMGEPGWRTRRDSVA